MLIEENAPHEFRRCGQNKEYVCLPRNETIAMRSDAVMRKTTLINVHDRAALGFICFYLLLEDMPCGVVGLWVL